MSATPVVVMAKAPLPGVAKTRLIPALGADGAARLAERFLRHTVAQALAAQCGPVELCLAGDASHRAVHDLVHDGRVALAEQGAGDLGERMARALRRAVAAHGAALLVGTDAPRLDATYLRGAAAALERHDAVLGPAEDGGYVLIGVHRVADELFAGMRWSHAGVLEATRARLAALGWRHAELAVLADVDEPADLVHVPPVWLAEAAS